MLKQDEILQNDRFKQQKLDIQPVDKIIISIKPQEAAFAISVGMLSLHPCASVTKQCNFVPAKVWA